MRIRAAIGVGVLSLSLAGCPAIPPYPYYGPNNTWTRQQALDEAQRVSDCLLAYVDHWFDRGRPPEEEMPEVWPASGWDARTFDHPQCNGQQLVPDGRDPGIASFRMVREEDIDPATQWGSRPARLPVDYNATQGYFPDPHVTYVLMPHMFAPVGTKIVFEGEFPHSRYFSIQPSPAYQPELYRYGGFGLGEVAFVDADIAPLPGHVNPFRAGANRNATNRSYRVECTVAFGNPATLDPEAWTRPWYRQDGNHRYCGTFFSRGPWGDPAWDAKDVNGNGPGDALGLWNTGEVWVRYYAPDHAYYPYGGVEFPRVTYQLPDGRRFYINADITEFAARVNALGAAQPQAPEEPRTGMTAGLGWLKMFGIFRAVATGEAFRYGYTWDKAYIRNLDKGVAGRDASLPGPAGQEPSSTVAVHINYLNRGMCVGAGKVFTVSGRLPTFPDTRGGAGTMSSAEMRYWSLTSYSARGDYGTGIIPGLMLTSVMDDELVLNADGEYVLVYSRPQDRPVNATAANGVTWKEWPPEACMGFTLRWMTIGGGNPAYGNWSFSKSIHETNAGWETDWAATSFVATKLYRNNRSGFLGAYQPVVGYRTKAQFEAIAGPITPAKIPAY